MELFEQNNSFSKNIINNDTFGLWRLILMFGLGSVFIFGTLMNALVVVIFYRRPSLRSISTRFTLSLTAANLLSSLVVAPLQLFRLAGFARWSQQHSGTVSDSAMTIETGLTFFWWCQSARTLMSLSVEGAIFSILLISVDRYYSVTSPLHYSMKMTREKSFSLLLATWTMATVYALLPFVAIALSNWMSEYHVPTSCHLESNRCWKSSCSLRSIENILMFTCAVLVAILGFLLPFIVMGWYYFRMYQAAHGNSERTRRHSLSANPTEMILHLCPTKSGTHTGISARGRRRGSNAASSSSFFREEGRAMKTALIVMLSFLVPWLPYFAFNILEIFISGRQLRTFEEVVTVLALSSSCILPHIYVYRNENIRKEALKLICWWRKLATDMPSFDRNHLRPIHSQISVETAQPETKSVYAFTKECLNCGATQVLCTLNSGETTMVVIPQTQRFECYRQMGITANNGRNKRVIIQCRECRHEATTPTIPDEPQLLDYLHQTNNINSPWRSARPYATNISVTTRSDSSASTNSSVVSGTISGTIPRGPVRRNSTVSTDSGIQLSRKLEDLDEDSVSSRLLPNSPKLVPLGDEVYCFQSANSCQRSPANSFQPPPLLSSSSFNFRRPPRRQTSTGSCGHSLWEVDECDLHEDEEVVIDDGICLDRPCHSPATKVVTAQRVDVHS